VPRRTERCGSAKQAISSIQGFLERDEGEREPATDRFAWDGVSGVRPFRGFAATTTVGVY